MTEPAAAARPDRPAVARMLRRFLRDRAGVILLAYVLTGAILLLAWLLLTYEGLSPRLLRLNAGYAFLLATTLLLLYLAADLARWWPHAVQVQALLEAEVDLTALTNLPAGGTADQEAGRALLEKLHSLAVAEVFRYQEAHRQHLAFINLWVHQMKTPVAAINLIAQQAAEAATPDAQREAMQSVEEETAKLAEGLEMVLTMARLQDFALDFHIRRTDLLAAVREAINKRKKQFIRLAIFPEVEADPAVDWTVLTDSKWNGFVIDQIISNALKYASQAREGAQRLRFRLSRNGQAVQLTIADEGPGIPPQDLPRVFEPFFTGENGRRYADATGIGLYLVRVVTERLGHEVAIDSTVGEGTAVTVTYLTNL